MKPITKLIAILAVGVLSASAWAQSGHHGTTISVENPWARATPPMAKTGAAYLTIRNTGQTADRVVSASSPAAEAAEIHTHIHDGNVMRMRKVDGVDIPAGKTVAFAPGGHHVMLIGLKAPLKQGESIALTLNFEKAGKVEVTVPVRGIGAMGHGSHSGGAHGHGSGMHGRKH